MSINFSKAKIKFCLSLYYNGINSYLYENKTKVYKFISISKDFTKAGQSEISLNDTVYNISVDHSWIKKEGILNSQKHLMVKNNTK